MLCLIITKRFTQFRQYINQAIHEAAVQVKWAWANSLSSSSTIRSSEMNETTRRVTTSNLTQASKLQGQLLFDSAIHPAIFRLSHLHESRVLISSLRHLLLIRPRPPSVRVGRRFMRCVLSTMPISSSSTHACMQ